jgi:hypothetical protein
MTGVMPSGGGLAGRYSDARAHALRDRYLAAFGGDEIPVPVESIAEDLLGLRVEAVDELGCSGMLVPASRLILLDAAEAAHGETPIRRHRFTIAHELGHWVCHCAGLPDPRGIRFCRVADLAETTDRGLEREANVFAAELLMPEGAVRSAWEAAPGEVAACAERLGVSQLAMHWRLYSFDLVDERPA